ncbi:prepilin-type N-terminal cleavage/methylation domain-containing protein [Candidatus Gracilibacteria bacterium]|nr:prepilin-type N-terminal cleavage/methylation domain-containing protein [Candidatus Gracilibacteria bacterium]
MKYFISLSNNKGFTFIEMLLVIAAIAILAAVVLLVINPRKHLGETENARRQSDVNTILNAVYQYVIDNDGDLPGSIPLGVCGDSVMNEICRTEGVCAGLVNLSKITQNEKYIITMPIDPRVTNLNGTGYHISRTVNERIVVCAPKAEQGMIISVAR